MMPITSGDGSARTRSRKTRSRFPGSSRRSRKQKQRQKQLEQQQLAYNNSQYHLQQQQRRSSMMIRKYGVHSLDDGSFPVPPTFAVVGGEEEEEKEGGAALQQLPRRQTGPSASRPAAAASATGTASIPNIRRTPSGTMAALEKLNCACSKRDVDHQRRQDRMNSYAFRHHGGKNGNSNNNNNNNGEGEAEVTFDVLEESLDDFERDSDDSNSFEGVFIWNDDDVKAKKKDDDDDGSTGKPPSITEEYSSSYMTDHSSDTSGLFMGESEDMTSLGGGGASTSVAASSKDTHDDENDDDLDSPRRIGIQPFRIPEFSSEDEVPWLPVAENNIEAAFEPVALATHDVASARESGDVPEMTDSIESFDVPPGRSEEQPTLNDGDLTDLDDHDDDENDDAPPSPPLEPSEAVTSPPSSPELSPIQPFRATLDGGDEQMEDTLPIPDRNRSLLSDGQQQRQDEDIGSTDVARTMGATAPTTRDSIPNTRRHQDSTVDVQPTMRRSAPRVADVNPPGDYVVNDLPERPDAPVEAAATDTSGAVPGLPHSHDPTERPETGDVNAQSNPGLSNIPSLPHSEESASVGPSIKRSPEPISSDRNQTVLPSSSSWAASRAVSYNRIPSLPHSQDSSSTNSWIKPRSASQQTSVGARGAAISNRNNGDSVSVDRSSSRGSDKDSTLILLASSTKSSSSQEEFGESCLQRQRVSWEPPAVTRIPTSGDFHLDKSASEEDDARYNIHTVSTEATYNTTDAVCSTPAEVTVVSDSQATASVKDEESNTKPSGILNQTQKYNTEKTYGTRLTGGKPTFTAASTTTGASIYSSLRKPGPSSTQSALTLSAPHRDTEPYNPKPSWARPAVERPSTSCLPAPSSLSHSSSKRGPAAVAKASSWMKNESPTVSLSLSSHLQSSGTAIATPDAVRSTASAASSSKASTSKMLDLIHKFESNAKKESRSSAPPPILRCASSPDRKPTKGYIAPAQPATPRSYKVRNEAAARSSSYHRTAQRPQQSSASSPTSQKTPATNHSFFWRSHPQHGAEETRGAYQCGTGRNSAAHSERDEANIASKSFVDPLVLRRRDQMRHQYEMSNKPPWAR